jgi:hypothetical protein
MLRAPLPAAPLGLCGAARGRSAFRGPLRAPLQVVAVRNRGRLRDPYDTPLRDGNRDRCGAPARLRKRGAKAAGN